jgi:DNA-binding transcriptional ArsR family regulator
MSTKKPTLSVESTGETGVVDEGDGTIGNDEIFHLLSNARRRYVLHCLLQRGGYATKRELSRQVAAWENDVPPEQVTSDMRKPVYIALHQTHIPQLVDQGLVEAENGDITLTDRAEHLRTYLEVVEADDISWGTFYFGLSGLSMALAAAHAAGLAPWGALSGGAVAGLIATAFAATSAVQVARERRNRVGGAGPPPELDE